MDIRDRGRYRLQRRSEHARQAQKWAMEIIVAGLATRDELGDPREAFEQGDEFRLDLEDHPPPESGDAGDVADKLHCIAKALFGVDEQRSPLQGLAKPLGAGSRQADTQGAFHFPAPLVFVPARQKPAADKQCKSPVEVRFCPVGLERQGLLKRFLGLIEAIEATQCEAKRVFFERVYTPPHLH